MTRRALVSHKLRDFQSGDPEFDRRFNEFFREYIANNFDDSSYLFKHAPDHEITEAEISAGVTPTNFQYPTLYVDRYGTNSTPGTTDITLAVRAAVSVAAAAGGGTITFLPGTTYLFSTVDTRSVVIPISTDYADGTENHQYHVLLNEVDNITFDLNGATLVSDETGGGSFFLCDGARNIGWLDGKFESTESHNSSGTTLVAGFNPIGATSQNRDSFNLWGRNLEVEDATTFVYIFGTATPTYRVRGCNFQNIYFNKGRYPVALHMNGDNVTVHGLHTIDVLRACFVYGVDGFDLQITNQTGVGGFTPLIKAYTRNTTNGRVRYKTAATVTAGAHFYLQSEHENGVTPSKLLNIEVDLDNSEGNVKPGVALSILEDGVETSSGSQVFHGVVLKGIFQNAPSVLSTQDDGSLDTDGIVLLAGTMTSVYDATGFYDPKQQWGTFTPVLKINNSTTGITYSNNDGEFWRDGRFIEAIYDITLSSKGAGNGFVSLDLPVTSSVANLNNAVAVNVLGVSNMASLSGPIIGYVEVSGDRIILHTQEATEITLLDDSNLTNTSRLQVQVRYPLW